MLRGDKVVLRTVEREDLRRLHELAQQVELGMFGESHWEPIPFAADEKDFERELEQVADRAWFVIEADNLVIGNIGLHHKNRFSGSTAFGVAIGDPNYVGKGYGREAIALFLDWAFRIQNWRRIWLDVFAPNERAIRAYTALGFVEEGRLRQHTFFNGAYVDAVVMGLLRSEWERRAAAIRE